MQYIICPYQIYEKKAPYGLYEWDSTHYCAVEALTPAEKKQFWVYEMTEVPPPEYDPIISYITEISPHLVVGVWTQRWQVDYYTQQQADENLVNYKNSKKDEVDADSALCYATALEGLNSEYAMSAEDAQAYKDSGYVDPVPTSVQSLANAMDIPPNEAADLMLEGAAEYKFQQNDVRAHRLGAKAQINAAEDYYMIEAIMEEWKLYVEGTLPAMAAIYSNL